MKYRFLLSLFVSATCFARVINFPAAEGMTASAKYTLKAGGKDIVLYDAPFAAYGVFDFDGTAEVTVKALTRDVKWVDVRPLSLGIKVKINRDSTFSFTLTKPCNISIEINGECRNFPLFLFTNAPETNVPDKKDKNVIFYEAGKMYRPNSIELKSNQTLYIEGGAVVEANVVATDAQNICVRGRGILLGTHSREFNKEHHRMFNLFDCKNIELADILVIDSHSWDVAPFHCSNVNIHSLRIVSDNGGDDGMDIVLCKKVNIKNCFIHTKDDCIAVKSFSKKTTRDNTDGIEVSDCVFWNSAWGNAIEIGFELMSDSVNNIFFRNCDVIHVEGGAAFSIHNSDRAVVHNIVFENIRVEDANQKLVDLAIFISRYCTDGKNFVAEEKTRYLNGIWDNVWNLSAAEKKQYAANRGKIENVVFRNIEVIEGYAPFSVICGWDEDHKISGVVFENIFIHGMKITNAEELKLYTESAENITIR